MKVIAIKQPWAWLIVNGYKDVENRIWRTEYRGPILIHACKTIDHPGLEWVKKNFPKIPFPEKFQLGGIVGCAELSDCVTQSESPWFSGPYGFVMRFPEPSNFLRARGQLGIYNYEEPIGLFPSKN